MRLESVQEVLRIQERIELNRIGDLREVISQIIFDEKFCVD